MDKPATQRRLSDVGDVPSYPARLTMILDNMTWVEADDMDDLEEVANRINEFFHNLLSYLGA